MPRARKSRNVVYLLIDISNSFTKLAFATRTRTGAATRVPTKQLTRAWLQRFLGRREVAAIVTSSVVPARNAVVRAAAGSRRVLFVNWKCELGVGIDYPSPHTIGADRLANAAAVAQLYAVPAVVVDFGTAVTFDVVSAEGKYVGGVIAPGLEAMTNFLYQRTALLPKLTLREPKTALGRSTRSAMLAGAIYGYRGLVREILARIAAQAFRGRRARVVATGGYAELIARQLPQIEAVHPNLTLEGLRLIGNLNA